MSYKNLRLFWYKKEPRIPSVIKDMILVYAVTCPDPYDDVLPWIQKRMNGLFTTYNDKCLESAVLNKFMFETMAGSIINRLNYFSSRIESYVIISFSYYCVDEKGNLDVVRDWADNVFMIYPWLHLYDFTDDIVYNPFKYVAKCHYDNIIRYHGYHHGLELVPPG